MSRIDFVLKRLNPEQCRATTSPSPVILCMAGAGSGKTSVLTSRIANLQVNHRVGTSNMLALTFTRLAAKEMKERVGKLIGDELAKKLTAGTFHSFCVRVLREFSEKVCLDSDFSIYGQDDQMSLLETIIEELRYTAKVRASMVEPWAMQDDTEMKAVIDEYHYRLRQNNAVDLDGLLHHTLTLLETHEPIREQLREQYTHIFIDEYQDTSDIQERIVNLISPQNLFIVGDPSQAIYGWRNAKVENILTFEERHPGCEVIRLEWNYRSAKPILDLANEVIAASAYKSPLQLKTDKDGAAPSVTHYADDEAEAQAIVKKIHDIKGPRKEIAVLCRTNRQIGLVDTALQTNGIPTFVVNAKQHPFNAYDVRKIIDYMMFFLNPRDERALNRIINWPERRIGDIALLQAEPDDIVTLKLPELGNLAALREDLQKRPCWHSVQALWKEIVDSLGIHERYEREGLLNRTDELFRAETALVRWEEKQYELGERVDPHTFIRWLRTRDIQERLAQEEADGVRILTIHAAKGLEWDHVFIVGCNEDILPSKRGDLEEERRLFYVAVTRAREALHMSVIEERETFNGHRQELRPSRFLNAKKL